MDQENDHLGLDQPLKLGRVSRIPKLTDELLLDSPRGLVQVRNNYRKLIRSINRNDKKLPDASGKKSSTSRSTIECEVENLQKVLSFYQLWCHGLFPRATFSDCLKMLRRHKSVALKAYRRGLLSNEIRRLKIEKGIIVDDADLGNGSATEDGLYGTPQNDIAASFEEPRRVSDPASAHPNQTDSDDEDWGFLSVSRRKTNGLFVGEEDDDDDAPSSVVLPASSTATVSTKNVSEPTQTEEGSSSLEQEWDFADSDDPEDGHDQELEIMREMGM